MRGLRGAVLAVLLAGMLESCGTCGTSSAPAADLAAARIQGPWQLTVAVASYSGPPPPSTTAFPSGHKATDGVFFQSTCRTAGSCTLQLWDPTGPDPSKQASFQFFSTVTGLQGPPVSTPMTESGSTYTQTFGAHGFGGSRCAPSQTVARPEQRLTLQVTAATQGGSGWTATALTGTETFIAGWGCAAAGFTGWTTAHLGITGRPG
jgi:hypothetical protein